MQETLHNTQGRTIAYIDYSDDNTIYLWNGTPTGYLDSDNRIYGFNGKHLGWYEDGILWDLNGNRTGFNKQSLPVFAKFGPFKSFKQFKPFKSFKEFAKYKPLKSNACSDSDLSNYLMLGIN
ncbi:4-fold beta flower protein [Flavobacterium aquiphilum]|uniref:4-fold beta flower protein n=1 Tax=Flavobacterium aquiphilum TaxID=3003261 RepID=UPI0024804AC5|nr:hypothetical protein [Flavobacterium aquiphilum]